MSRTANIAKVKCGEQEGLGTAILVDAKHAITVRHCVENYLSGKTGTIFLVRIRDKKFQTITISEVVAEEGEQFALLTLDEAVSYEKDYTFTSCELEPFQALSMFGYGKIYADGRWIELKSVGNSEPVSERVCDLKLEPVDAKDNTFEGYSGSPVFLKGTDQIVGLAMAETCMDGEAVVINGISVFSQNQFFEKWHIPLTVEQNAPRETEGKAEVLPTGTIHISGAEVSGEPYNTILYDISEKRRRGARKEAMALLDKYINLQEDSDSVTTDMRAKFLLQKAIWLLEDSQNLSAAGKSYKKAMTLNPSLDARTFCALKAFCRGENDACEILKPIDSVQILNFYMQICVNRKDADEAIDAYTTYEGVFEYNEGTWYIASVAYLRKRDFEKAEELVDRAIAVNQYQTDYYLMRALIRYWESVPEDIFLESGELYPGLYSEGVYLLSEDSIHGMREAVADFSLASEKAAQAEDEEKTELALSCWIHALSVDNAFLSECKEPLSLLESRNPYHVTVLLVKVMHGDVREDLKYENRLRALISKKKNMFGYVIVLLEYLRRIHDDARAKSLLFQHEAVFSKYSYREYWYRQLSVLEQDSQKCQDYAEWAARDSSLTDAQKERLACMFAENSDKDILPDLEVLYTRTGEMQDLLYIVHYCSKIRDWDRLLNYSRILREKHGNSYGYLYELKAYIGKRDYSSAWQCIQEIERLKSAELNQRISIDKLEVLEKLGEYGQALATGKELFSSQPTETNAHRLANLYLKEGSLLDAIHVLQEADDHTPLSGQGNQRLSGLYRTVDPQKSFMYAEKYVEISRHSPESLAWAATLSSELGKSEVTDIYLKELMDSHSDTNIIRQVNLEELLESAREMSIKQEEWKEKYQRAEIPLHIFLDSRGNLPMAALFCEDWLNPDRFSMVSFGGHFIEKINLDMIILDYSSCLFLYEMGVLRTLAEHISRIYIPEDMFPMIIMELSLLETTQEELFSREKELLRHCKEDLKLDFVEPVFPDNLDSILASERADAILLCTAERNGALCVDLDPENGSMICVDEIYAALSEIGYPCSYASGKVRSEKLSLLRQKKRKLLVPMAVLSIWSEKGILDDIAAFYELILPAQECQQAEEQWKADERRRATAAALRKLNDCMQQLNRDGKLKWCPETELSREQPVRNQTYSKLLVSAVKMAAQEKIPYCVEDRYLQSLRQIDGAPICGAMDVIRQMHEQNWIDDSQYQRICQKLIDRKMGFYVPECTLVLRGLSLSSVSRNKLVKSELLLEIEAYTDQACHLLEQYESAYRSGNQLSEKTNFHAGLLICLGSLIGQIWMSAFEPEKKPLCSEWVLFRYCRFGETIARENPRPTDALIAVPLTHLILQGVLFVRTIELSRDYYAWLFKLISAYLENQTDLLDELVRRLSDGIFALFNHAGKCGENYAVMFEQQVSNGIHYMPDFLRGRLLENTKIQDTYNKYFTNVVMLGEDFYFPLAVWEEWYQEILSMAEGTETYKEYDGKKLTFSWSALQPSWPVLHVCVKDSEGRVSSHKQIYCEPRATASCVEEQIHLIVSQEWITNDEMAEYSLPADVTYLKDMYFNGIFLNEESRTLTAVPINIHGDHECGRSRNPVRQLHYLAWTLQHDVSRAQDELTCMLEFLDEGEYSAYGNLYFSLLKILYTDMINVDAYSVQSQDDRIIWTYIWTDLLYEEILRKIQAEESKIEDYKNTLCEYESNLSIGYDLSRGIDAYDLIDPSMVSAMRFCLLGSMELLLEYADKIERNTFADMVRCVEKRWNLPFQSADHALEFLVSHENAQNHWGTFFARNYPAEWNKLSRITYEGKDRYWIPEDIVTELKNAGEKETLSDRGRDLLLIECLNIPQGEEADLVKAVFEKFYMQSDHLVAPDEYSWLELILSRLPAELEKQFRVRQTEKLKERLLSGQSDWETVSEHLFVVVNGHYELFVEFWEQVSREEDYQAEPELTEWLAHLQLQLPFELGQRLYHAGKRLLPYNTGYDSLMVYYPEHRDKILKELKLKNANSGPTA